MSEVAKQNSGKTNKDSGNTQALASAVDEVILFAKTHFENERFEEAQNLYIEVLNIDPDNATANHDLGVIEATTKGAEVALPRLKKAVQFNPQSEQVWISYFDALTQLDDLEGAKVALEQGQNFGLTHATAKVLASEVGITLENEVLTERIIRLPKLKPLNMEAVNNFSSTTYWQVSNRERFEALMDEAKKLVSSGFYFGDNLFTWGRNNSFLDDDVFSKAWQDNCTSDADAAIAWRRFFLACAAHHCVQLEGDFVECGTYNGSGVKTVMDYIGGVDFPKTFWAYDTFDYNPVDGHAFTGQVEGLYETVQARFADYKQVNLIKGFIPDSFADGIPEKIAYLHIDLNNADGEIAALEHLFDRVVSGGMIILDDYEWSHPYRAQKEAEDPWFEARGYKVFALPTGQGFLIKR